MKIVEVTLREVQMPLAHPFETSFGVTTGRRILLIELTGEDGTTSCGECVAGEHPYFSEEYVETAWAVTEDELAPRLLNASLDHGSECPAIFEQVRGHRMAKAALENAVWEMDSIRQQMPLWKLLGGVRKVIPAGVSIGIQASPEKLMDVIAKEVAAGYQRIKLKCKPGWDEQIFAMARERWPDIVMSCDANSAYRLSDAERIATWDRFHLLMIEQPLWHDDFYFHARLQRQIKTAICLDECIRNRRDAQAALELGSGRIINIKVGRVGGFTEAIAVHDVAAEHGVPVWCGGMLETGIGRAQNIALSTLENFKLPGDVSASQRYWAEDIIEPEVVVSAQGEIAAPAGIGRGYAEKPELIERLTVRKKVLRRA
jgi:O-succinylbenzoate synthase